MTCVCIVDDDASVRKAIGRVLRSAGFEVRAFASAAEYLDQFDPVAPGCLVLDLNMPGVDGLALRRALARSGPGPGIVFMSGDPTLVTEVQHAMAGDAEFLAKPVDAARLVEAVRAAMLGKRAIQEDAT